MVGKLQFIFSDFPDVQTAWYLGGHELICHGYPMARASLLALALFSPRGECHGCLLADVVPISMKVLQEWQLIRDMFGDVEEVRECLHVITSRFLARSRANSFRTMFTVLTLTPMARAHIGVRAYQSQTYGEIDSLQEPCYMSSMRDEFSHFLKPDIKFEPDEIIGQRADDVRHGFAKADRQEKGEAIEEEKFHDSSDGPPVEEAPRFAKVLQEEFHKPLEEGLNQDLLDRGTGVAEVDIRQ
jgi:hypothetical protein